MSDGLTRGPPEAHGVSAADVDAFLADASRLGVELNSFMLWRGGDVIAEGWWRPYAPERRHMMHSATKSFLSAGVGLAVQEGLFGLEDKVVSFFPDQLPDVVGDNLAAMTVEDLLTQTSGHAVGASGSVWRSIKTSWIAEFFKIPVVYPPGSFFRYSSATSFMLSAILSKTSGQSAHDYLKPRLLAPLGIDNLTWDVGPEGINPGGNGASARTADLLKLAILHLRGGVWGEVRLLPEAWTRTATSALRGNPYGYHWWAGPGGAFYAYGVFGQFAVVLPEHDAALALTGAAPYGEETLRSLIWRHFPAMFERRETPNRATGHPGWSNLRLADRSVSRRPEVERKVSGRTFLADPNEDGVRSFSVTFGAGEGVYHFEDGRGRHAVAFGLEEGVEGETSASGGKLHHGYEPGMMRVVAFGAWRSETELEMTWQFVETAFRDTVVLRFVDGGASLDRSVNTNSGALRRPTVFAKEASSPTSQD